MAINKKLIHFNKKESFNIELANNNILNTSIVFIKDSKEIWTHGQLYATQLTVAEIESIIANSPSIENALAQIAAEVTARDKAITAEKHRAEQAEATLSANIEAEITRSTAKDEAHTAAINKEIQDRTNAIATEVINRDAAIEVETNRALAAERTLQTNINSTNTAINNEVDRATEAEQLIQTNLTNEITRAKAAEQGLDSKITDHTNITDTALALKADKSDTYTKSQVDQKVSGLYKVKGSSTFEDLPKTNAVGDTYNITNSFTLNEVVYPAGTNIVYTGNGWDALSGVFDTTALEGSIQTVADNLTKESVRAKDAESALSTSIATEVADRKQADTTIQSNITTLTNKVNANEIKLSTIQGDYKTEGSINKALEDAKAYTNSVVSGLDSTVTDTDGNVSVSITETDGKLFNVDVNVDEESMASVMSGLMGTPLGYKQGVISTEERLDNTLSAGYYEIRVTITVSETEKITVYGNMLVIVGGKYTTQICVGSSGTLVRRYQQDNGAFSSWQRIDNFGYNSLAELSSGIANTITPKFIFVNDVINYSTVGVAAGSSTAVFGKALFKYLAKKYPNKNNVTFFLASCGFSGVGSAIIHIYDTSDTDSDGVPRYGSGTCTNREIIAFILLTSFNIRYQNIYISDEQYDMNVVDWYGVSWSENNSNPTCTRIGNMSMHRSLPILSAMKGYAITTIKSIRATPGIIVPYDFVNKKVFYSNDSNSYAPVSDNAPFNIVVKIPEFWYIDEYEYSTKTHNLKISQTAKAGWNHHKEAYVGAYEGVVSDDVYISMFNYTPSVSVTRDAIRTKARANGDNDESKWNIYTYEEHRAICHLFLVEYATRNCQAPVNSSLTAEGFRQGGLGSGCTTGAMNSAYSFIPTGTTDSLGNGSGQVAYTASNGTVYYANRYRGIENPFGHVWKHCDDVISVCGDDDYRTWYKCEDPSQFATNKNSAYKPICSRKIPANGYKKEIAVTINCDFFADATGGSESTYWCDYSYDSTDTSEHCLLIGGCSSEGGKVGLFYLDSDSGVGDSTFAIGSRLTYLPWAK